MSIAMEQMSFKFGVSIQERFEKFDRENQKVYEYLVEFVFQKHREGRKLYSIGALFEELRWYVYLKTNDENFKLNNDYRSRYVRKLIREYPELESFFELRELRAE